MKAFVFTPTNEPVGKFVVDRPDQLSTEVEKFVATVSSLPDYCYVEAFQQTWTIVSRSPIRLEEGRVIGQKTPPRPIPTVTTQTFPGATIIESRGIVTGEAIMGANLFRDIAAGVRDVVGGRSSAYEEKLREGRNIALEEMMSDARQRGADAVVAVTIEYEVVGANGSMLMICATGTAVTLGRNQPNKAPEPTPGPVTPRATD